MVTDFLEKIRQAIDTHHLLSAGDKVIVALSGGPDSVALMIALNILIPKYNFYLAAAHLDHSLRPDSKDDRDFCRQLCQTYKIRFYANKTNINRLAAREKLSLEEAGRQARYAYFNHLCRQSHFTKIATGHTLDDTVETVVFNMARGCGLSGLGGIPVKRDNIIRPLINIEKKEILDWLKSEQIPYRTDPTNLTDQFSRNKIRLGIVPKLAQINPQAKQNIARMASLVSEELNLIGGIVKEAYAEAAIKEGKLKIVLDLGKLIGYDESLRKKVLEKAYRKLSHSSMPLSSHMLSRALALLDGRSGAQMPLAAGINLEKSQGRVSVYRINDPHGNFKLIIPGKTRFDDSGNFLETKIIKRREWKGLDNENRSAYLDSSKIKDAQVRFRRSGDRMAPLGMRGHRLLSDILIDARIPEFERNSIPLITTGKKIVWIAGVMISNEFRVTPRTKEILNIRLCEPS